MPNAISDALQARALRVGRLLEAIRHSVALATDAYRREDDDGLIAALDDVRCAADDASKFIIARTAGNGARV